MYRIDIDSVDWKSVSVARPSDAPMKYPKSSWASTPGVLLVNPVKGPGARLKFASGGILRLSALKLAAKLPIYEGNGEKPPVQSQN